MSTTSFAVSLTTASIDSGGGRAISANYVNDGSSGGISGISTASGETARHGYVGQLTEVISLTVTGAPSAVNETGTCQLGAAATMDDETITGLAGSEILWSIPTWPIHGIDSSGVATTEAVYADTPGAFSGSYFGRTGSGLLLVLDSLPDNYGSYAGDGLPDGWQVRYFGLDNPGAAPGNDADGDGMSNLQEFLAGTDPTNNASAFRITSIVNTGDDVLVTWTMGTDKTNALQAASAGAAGDYTNNFTDIFTVTNTIGTVTNFIDVGGATNFPVRYYRVRLVP